MGVFRSRANAERLYATLRTYFDEVNSGLSEDDLYTVTVGPFSDLQQATESRDRIAADLDIAPIIMQFPF